MPVPRRTFEEILPLLVSTYRQGCLVPFIGAGMSAGRLSLWPEFVDKLETEACIPHDESLQPYYDVRAQAACTKIRNSYGRDCFLDAVRRALSVEGESPELPPQTTSLAAIDWPLVVSTNYDDLYFGACRRRRSDDVEQMFDRDLDVDVLGRSPKDCKLVLSSLHGPFDRRYIWHVQGFLGGQFGGGIEEKVADDLRDQLVIGHAEYRLVTNAAPHFRRCFGELFNSRSFLFLGSNLREDYFTNLFGEVLDLCGPSHVPHFALTKEGQVDVHFLADQLNITVCEFKDWGDLPGKLECLGSAIRNPRARSAGWSFEVGHSPADENDLEIVLGLVALKPGPHEVIALAAHRDEHNLPCLDPEYAQLSEQYPSPQLIGDHIFKYGDEEVYALTARSHKDDDDNAVDDLVSEFLNRIHSQAKDKHDGQVAIHLQLSPTAGTVPPVFAFMRVVHAFGRWKRTEDKEVSSPLRLILYVQGHVEFNLTSGRIDVQELLSSDLIRFWSIVFSDAKKEPVRRILHYREDAPLSDVLDDLGVPFGEGHAEWSVSICPSPRKPLDKLKTTTWSLYEHNRAPTLSSIGIVFGSVLTLECVAADCLGIAVAAK
jgi:hypothetical protein